MNKEELEKAIENLPHIEIDNKRPVSAYNSVDIRVIQECIDSMNNNIKSYIELAQENKQLKERIEQLENSIDMYDVVLQQTEKEKTREEIIHYQLQNRIDKAIEYINGKLEFEGNVLIGYEIETLLEILKGE